MSNFQEKPFGALLVVFAKNHYKYVNNRLQEVNLNVMQAVFLTKIYTQECCCQNDLVKHFCVTKGSVAKSLKDLEEKGLITRERIPENRRQYKVKCTDKAQDIVLFFREINSEWEEKVGLTNLGSDFTEEFRKLTENSVKLNEGEI